VLQNLRTDGIVPTLGLLPEQVAELTAYLTERPCYQGHVRVYGDRVPRPHGHPDLGPVFCHAMADVLSAPHFWELALRTAPVARIYLGAAAHMYSVNAFWARPWPGEPTHDLQTWHRDGDDVRFLALFAYGTDVLSSEDGPHRFVLGSHEDRVDLDRCATIYGPAGTAFLADTRGLHMGERPRAGCRLLLWARWGVSERPVTYDVDELAPVPAALLGDRYPSDPASRAAVRLVAA
jgi:hypothetical protein